MERLMEQTRRAEIRYKQDKTRREERKHSLEQLLSKQKKVDFLRIDDRDRITGMIPWTRTTAVSIESSNARGLMCPHPVRSLPIPPFVISESMWARRLGPISRDPVPLSPTIRP